MKIRKVFDHFDAYGWETPSWEIASDVGLKEEQITRLDTNASQYAPEAALKRLSRELVRIRVNDYPDTSYRGLSERIASYTGRGPGRLVITNGADEGLDIISKVFIDRGDEVILPTPTYSMYRVVTQTMGGKVRAVQRKPTFELDVEGILAAVNPRTKLIFLCNPNNPTGNASPIDEVERLAKESGVAVAIDEAYFELCGMSSIDLTDRYENVIVCRTMSKAFSMAAVRVGYLVAKKETVETLNLVRPPNSLSVLSIVLGEAGFANLGEMRRNVRATVENREDLFEALTEMSDVLTPYPSATNFILFRLKEANADRVHRRLMEKGLVLRNLSHVPGVENCLRTTVGTPETNERLVAELKKAASGQMD